MHKVARWSFLHNNEYLRRIIKAKMEVDGFSVSSLARECGIYRQNLSKYLNNSQNRHVSDFQILKVCEKLNLEIELNIEVKVPDE